MLNRPPAGDHFCGAKVLLQKERHPYGCLSFWSGRRGSLAALPGRHTHTGTKTCHRHVFLAALVPFRASARLDQKETPPIRVVFFFGAGDEARTRYLDLGKVALYQMSYARTTMVIIRHRRAVVKPFFCSCRFFHRYDRCKTQKPPPGTVTVSITYRNLSMLG